MAIDPKTGAPPRRAVRGSTLAPLSFTVLALVLINVAIAAWLASAIGSGPAGITTEWILALALIGVLAAVGAVLLWLRWLRAPSA